MSEGMERRERRGKKFREERKGGLVNKGKEEKYHKREKEVLDETKVKQ